MYWAVTLSPVKSFTYTLIAVLGLDSCKHYASPTHYCPSMLPHVLTSKCWIDLRPEKGSWFLWYAREQNTVLLDQKEAPILLCHLSTLYRLIYVLNQLVMFLLLIHINLLKISQPWSINVYVNFSSGIYSAGD